MCDNVHPEKVHPLTALGLRREVRGQLVRACVRGVWFRIFLRKPNILEDSTSRGPPKARVILVHPPLCHFQGLRG